MQNCVELGLTVDDEYDTLMGKILVPESRERVADDTILCETWHPVNSQEADE